MIENGQPRCTIVIASTTNWNVANSVKMAGAEIAHVLQKMSGGEIKVVPEPQLERASIPAEAKRVLIYVGPTEFAKKHGLAAHQLAHEEAVIRTEGDALILIGDDRIPVIGSYNATTLFLEKYLDVRWLWPGELGEVIPRRATVRIPEKIAFRQTPSVKIRTWRDRAQNGTFFRRYATPDGWTEAEIHQFAVDSSKWYLRNRMQKKMGIDLRAGHAYGLWFRRFAESHPEYFAVQPCGKRDLDPKHGGDIKLCHSNPAVIDRIVADIEEAFQKEPNLPSYSLSPNDGGFTGHCMCDRCKSWDEPKGPPMRLQDAVTREWFDYVSLSDRMVRFYNAVAERVTKKHPKLLLLSHAYCAYNPPPVRATLHPNVVISYVGKNPYRTAEGRAEERKLWEGWSRTGCAMMWRPNWLDQLMGIPYDNSVWLAEDLRYAVKHCRLLGTDFDSQYHVWGGMGLPHYILARLLWDVNQDVDAIVDDYCRAGFGKAAPAMRDYFMQVRRVTENHYAKHKPGQIWAESNGPGFYDEAFFRGAHKSLAKAASLAVEDSPEVLGRVDFFKKALEFTEMSIGITQRGRLYRNGDKSQRVPLIELERKRQRFFEDNRTSFVIWTVSIQFEQRRFAKYAYPVPEKELAKTE